MINLDERYHGKDRNECSREEDGVEERVKAYGWHCDGSAIVGHYVTTESYQLLYNMQGVFTKMVPLRELSQSIA